MTREFKRICVFCGSNDGDHPDYLEAAEGLGRHLAKQGIGVVYGGARVGMMGAVASGALAEGGDVIGVIPEKLQALEITHEGLTELFVVGSMHARKAMMAYLSGGFIAMPGGFGTLEEVFEVTTWTQLNYHKKPVGILNVRGYYDGLLEFLDHAASTGFIRGVHRPLINADTTAEGLLAKLRAAEIPEFPKWITKP